MSAFAWESLAPLPEGNGGFACGFIDGKLIMAGGTNWTDGTKRWLKTIRSYDPADNAWMQLGELQEPRAYAASGIVHGQLVMLGGSDGTKAIPSVISIDAEGRVKQISELKNPTIYSCSAASGYLLCAAGGSTDPADLGTFSNAIRTYRISASGDEIDTVDENRLPGPGFGTGALAFAEKAYLFGGAIHHPTTVVTNQDWIFSISEKGAARSSINLPHPIRGITAVALSDRYIYLGGGYPSDETGFTSEAYLFDGKKEKLRPATPLPIAAMVHLVSDGTHLYCLGGEDMKKHRSDKMWRIPVAKILEGVK